jgi:hypothetical protein
METSTIVAVVAIVLGWLASGLDDVIEAIRDTSTAGIIKTIFGILATGVGVYLIVSAETSKAENVSNLACTLSDEIKRNEDTLTDVLKYSQESRNFVIKPGPEAQDQFQRRLRMLEGSPFHSSFYNARSQEVSSLSGNMPKHVYTLYALMDVCREQVIRVLPEVRAEARPIIQYGYLSTIIDSCRHLQRPFKITLQELKSACKE